ncbi:MAG: hypothetical protein ACI87E_001194 [Mariniblastus sp.]|jgi:hypothetical protein
MICHTLTTLNNLQSLPVGRSDLLRVVCSSCKQHEVCPAMTSTEYDLRLNNNVVEADPESV